eukprot:6187308-Pleurochrysis_carterae.AAC.5
MAKASTANEWEQDSVTVRVGRQSERAHVSEVAIRTLFGPQLPNREERVAHGGHTSARSHVRQVVHVRMYMIRTTAVNNKPDVFALIPQTACVSIAETSGSSRD